MKAKGESGDIAPRILNLGTRFRIILVYFRSLYSFEIHDVIHSHF
jgi:hypothetical protein